MISEPDFQPGGPATAEPTQAPNEPTGQVHPPRSDSLFQKLLAQGRGIFERHGHVYKKGKGRPRLDGAPGKSDVSLNAPPGNTPAFAAPLDAGASPTFDENLVKKCVTAVGKSISATLDKKLHGKALAVTDKAFADQLTVETSITREELDAFGELTFVCLKKYGVGSEYAPEVGLFAIAIGIFMRFRMAFSKLDAELAKRQPSNVSPIK